MSGLKKEYEVVMCECQCEVPIEFAHINEDGNWTCANCLIDELTEKKANEASKPDAAALPIESVSNSVCACTGNSLKYEWCVRCDIFNKCKLAVRQTDC
jgi:hypothetical protein